MALNYIQRHDLIRSAEMGKRIDVAIWTEALSVLADGASTANQKQEARARLKRSANDIETRVCAIRLAADPTVTEAMTDAELQAIVKSVYNQLPAP